MFVSLLLIGAVLGASPDAKSLSAADAYQQGLARYRDADFEGAIPLFQRAVQAAPDGDKAGRARAEIWLGLAFMNIGNADLAKASFRGALLAFPGASLPDEAPPMATPMFANIKGELERSAPKPAEPAPVVAAKPPTPAPQPAPTPAPVAVKPPTPAPQPAVAAKPPPEVAPPPEAHHPDVPPAEVTQNELEGPPADAPPPTIDAPVNVSTTRFPIWLPEVTAGAGGALGIAAIGFKVASNSSFNAAEDSPLATTARTMGQHGSSQQSVALGLGVAAVAAVAAGTVLYLLNE